MVNRNDNRKNSNNFILVLFVLFFAIVLRDATIDTLNWAWVTFMGAVIIGLSLFAMFPPGSDLDMINIKSELI